MAAGLGFKDFVTGEVLTAADVDGYLMQGVWVFASAAARDAAVTSPQEGNFAYLKDTNVTTYYTGSAWANLDTTGMTNPMTTTGDTIYSSSGSTPARLGIGSTGQVLTVAGGVPTWATAASGGGMTLLSTTALSSTATTVSSINQTYTNLFVYIPTLTFSANATLAVTTNSTTNYYSVKQQNNSFVYDNAVGQIRTNSAGTTLYSGVVVNINRYSDAANHTGNLAYFDQNLGATGNTWFSINDAAAVTSITITSVAGTSSFNAGNVLIYGVK